MSEKFNENQRMEEVRKTVKELSRSVTSVNRSAKAVTKAVTKATRAAQAVATLLDFDEINKLKEKTVRVSASGTTATKQRTGEGTVKTKTQYPFWTQFGLQIQDAADYGYDIGGNLLTRIGRGIADAFGDAVNWVRKNLLEPILGGWAAMGTISLGLGAVITTTAQQLWTTLQGAWVNGGAKILQIGNTLVNSAATLWSNFSANWGTRAVSIGNSLVNSAAALWSKFSSGWGSRGVSIVNSLTNSAATLWEQFKRGWSGKSLGLKISYATNVGAVKTAVYRALGLSGWPSISFAARGGVFSGPTLTMLGEAGTEAVVPLENNTGWMDVMAQRLGERMGFGGSITVPVYIGGEKVAHHVVQAINSVTRRTGVSPLYV